MTVHITINGKEIEAEKGKTILEVARENDIYIPTLCYHSHLHPIGSCRLCVVDIEGYPMPMASCTTPVTDGIKVHTNTGRVEKMRRQAMELILVNHPLDCPVCDKGGECRLQDLAYEFGIAEQPYHAKKPEREHVPFSTPLIRQWLDRCVLCLRCVHVCHELVGNAAIDIKETGYKSVIYPVAPERCYSCGECLSVCPVGALTEAVNPFRGRVWQIERKQTTCGQCGVGCQVEVSTYENKPINIKTDGVTEEGPNYGSLCVRGRFFYDYVVSEERLVQPRIKKGKEWVTATWDEAYENAIDRLREIIKENGPDAVGFVASARLLNEDLVTIYEFAKKGLEVPNIDTSSRLDLAAHMGAFDAVNSVSTSNELDSLLASDVIIVAGGDVDLTAQVVANRIRVAQHLHDAKVITVNPFRTRLDEITDAILTCNSGTEIPVFNGLIKEAFGENPEIQKASGWEAFAKQLADYSAEAVCDAAQVDGEMFETAVELIRESTSISFVAGGALGQTPEGAQKVKAFANLALACKAAGKSITWLSLTAYANGLGAVKVQNAYGGGLSYGEMIQAAQDGKLKALVVVEEDPLTALPDTAYVREALEKLDFLMVVDLFESETAKLAHLLVPSCSFMEKDGTFVNLEGKIRAINQVMEPLEGTRAVGRIFNDIADKMKLDVALEPEAVQKRASDILKLEEKGSGHKGFFTVSYQATRMEENGHLFLIPADLHYNHHYGTSDIYAMAIEKLDKEPEYLMSPKDAVRMGVEEGTEVLIQADRGELSIIPYLTDEVKEGHLVVKGHYHKTGIQALFPFVMDNETKTPVTGFVRVKLQKP